MPGTNGVCDQRIWLVGASQGIGLCLAERLVQAGGRVIASARGAERSEVLRRLREQDPDRLTLLDIDVTDPPAIEGVCDRAWAAFGGLDVWIYNVGTYEPMGIEDWDLAEFERMAQTNYLGAVRLMHALAPRFLKQIGPQDGSRPPSKPAAQWIWNASLASDFGLPYGGGYSAPKAALVNLAESLQPELARHGIALKIINHGFVKTRLTQKNAFPMLGRMEADEAAERILACLDSKRFETRFPRNLASILGVLKRLPKPWSLALTRRMLKP